MGMPRRVKYGLIAFMLGLTAWQLGEHPEAIVAPVKKWGPYVATNLSIIFGAIALIYILRSIERTVLKRLRAVNLTVKLLKHPKDKPGLFDTHANITFTAVEKRPGGYIIDLSPAGEPGERLWVTDEEIEVLNSTNE